MSFFNFVTACSFVLYLSVRTSAGKVRIRHALQCLPLEKELQMLKRHENDAHPIQFSNVLSLLAGSNFVRKYCSCLYHLSEKTDTEIKPRYTC